LQPENEHECFFAVTQYATTFTAFTQDKNFAGIKRILYEFQEIFIYRLLSVHYNDNYEITATLIQKALPIVYLFTFFTGKTLYCTYYI